METRRLGRTGHQTSVLVFGAASLGDVDQDTADQAISFALESGINHFDTARDYGEAEVRMGPWMPRIRDQIFLATKTGERSAEAAWCQINESLERLQTDHVDLIQAHSVGNRDDLDAVLATGGAIESLVRARDEGLASWIGITGHTHEAPSVHTEALRRFDFDSVLTPLNRTLYADPVYAADYDELAETCRSKDVALRTIKMISRRNWREGEKNLATWYKPFTEQRTITAAITWLLKAHPEVAGLATAGETRLLEKVVRALEDGRDLSVADAEATLGEVDDYSSPFVAMPF